MTKINSFINNKMEVIIKLFLILNPFIDLLTSICIHVLNINLTIGIIFRFIFMFICIYYLLFIEKNKIVNKYLLILLLYCLLYCLNIVSYKSIGDSIYDTKQLLKIYYFPIVLITFYYFFKNREINSYFKLIYIVISIYLVLLIIPIITNTGFKSYSITKDGTVGWFNSANEIGGLLSILSPILLIFLYRKNKLVFKILISISFIISILKIGTKVPILSLFISLLITFIYFMVYYIKNKNYKKITLLFTYLIVLSITFILLLPKTTFYKNIETHLKFLKIDSVEELTSSTHYIDHFIFSERVTFYKKNKIIFERSSLIDKLFGIGYKNKYLRKMVEMDYYDVFFCHGIFGFIIFMTPLIFILVINRKKLLKNINFEKCMLLTSLILIVVLSLFSGHIIAAPSVSMYVALVIIILINYREELNEDRFNSNKL